jgi:hypothetical protein
VIAELALGSLKDRASILQFLDSQPQARTATLPEIRGLIDSRQLYARGIGLIDAHLLASSLITPVFLWTRDGNLRAVAEELGVLANLP